MTYDCLDQGDTFLLSDFCDQLELEPTFDYPAAVYGMRPLDYEPDTDDYEYQQSLLY